MVEVNIVYDECYDDADIISIPDNVYSRLEEIVREFLDWLPDSLKNDKDYWDVGNDLSGQILETVGFIKWLNNTYCQNGEKATIIVQHINWNPELDMIEW